MEFVESVEEGPLFTVGTTAAATVAFSRWAKRSVSGPRLAPAHSFRHRMEDELLKARVPAEAQDAITGRHNLRNAGSGYGKGFRGMPDELYREIVRIPSPVPPPAL